MQSQAPKRSFVALVVLSGGLAIAGLAMTSLASGSDTAPTRPAFQDDRPLTAKTKAATDRPLLKDQRPLLGEPVVAAPPIESRSENSAVPVAEPQRPVLSPAVEAPADTKTNVAAPLSPEPPSVPPVAVTTEPVAAQPIVAPLTEVPASPAPALPTTEMVPPSPAIAPVSNAQAIPLPALRTEPEAVLAAPKSAPVDVVPVPVEATMAPPAEATTKAVEPLPQTPPIATSAMVKRAQKHIEIGDIAGARLFLERGAAQGDAASVMLLGATYDPLWLAERGAQGVAADRVKAGALYGRARDMGVAEASDLLRKLEAARP